MCECGASLCDQRVPLSASDYELLTGIEPVLVEGHGPRRGGSLGDCPLCGGSQRRQRRQRR